jgi:nicotinate-nucleotide adenylyltransferase
MKKVGILGGTFDPVHLGHLAIAQEAFEKLNLDKVIFVPSHHPPHKSAKNVVPAQDRFNMVKLAVADNPRFDVSDFELKKGGKSYSIDTAEYFRNQFPKSTKLFFIIGDDSVATLHRWKRVDELTKIVAFIAVNRLGFRDMRSTVRIKKFTMLNLGISSSYVRKCIAENKSVRYLVPDDVILYMKKNKLYVK